MRGTVGYRSHAVHGHIALCGRAWISLEIQARNAETNKVATSGCFAAHPDVAARTATPREGAASMRSGT
jgi:hypothetical protein